MNATVFNASDTEDDAVKCEFVRHKWLFIKFLLISVIGTCVAAFGIMGNINTVAVLTRPKMRTPNNLFLTALAVFDAAVLVSAILLYSIEYVQEYFDDANMYLIWINSVPYLYALSNFAQTGSVYITVSVTFERYLAVVQPRIAQAQCTRPRAGVIIFIVIGFAGLFNMTKYFEIAIVRNESCTGFASLSIAPSDLMMDPLYNKVYTLWLTQFIMVFFPFGVLLTVNTAIVWNFRKSLKKLGCSMVDLGLLDRVMLKRRSRDATRVLVTIVVVFLICNCWGFVITLMESIYGVQELIEWTPVFYAFSREAINFLAIVNSSINFIICVIFSDDFRHELLVLYGFQERRQRQSQPGGRRRRSGFSHRRLTKQFSRASIVRLGGLFRLRYIDRVNSIGSSMNGSVGGDSKRPSGASFNALVDAARVLVNGTHVIDNDYSQTGHQQEAKEREIETDDIKKTMNGRGMSFRKSLRRGRLSACEPFLREDSDVSVEESHV